MIQQAPLQTNRVYLTTPEETEAGSAGEQPAKGYSGGAHQDDGNREWKGLNTLPSRLYASD
jgi:hypothetical protein